MLSPTGGPMLFKQKRSVNFVFILFISIPSIARESDFQWSQSLPITFEDPGIGTYGGTEIRSIVDLDGYLYAANGYFNDSESTNPKLPAPQVYRLDSANGQWQVEYELPTDVAPNGARLYTALSTLQKLTFETNRNGTPLPSSAQLLVGGVFSSGDGIDVFSRGSEGQWLHIPVPPQSYLPKGAQVRSFAVHHDQVTNIDMAFAGADEVIFSGGFEEKIHNIEWNSTADWVGPHPSKTNSQSAGRVTALTNCNGKLYAVTGADLLLERQDGPSPSWKTVYAAASTGKADSNTRGFSGLTCIANHAGGLNELLFSLQGNPTTVISVNPRQTDSAGNYVASVDLNVSSLLTQNLGTTAESAIVAYNNMTVYPYPTAECPSLLMGFSVHTPDTTKYVGTTHKYPAAGFLSRDCHGNYDVQWVHDPQISPSPELVAVRSIVVSPFPHDPPGTIYAGGFDAGNPIGAGFHNTAWLYKGVPAE